MNAAVSNDEARQAQQPHDLFLFNLIFNHVFLFIVTVSAPSLQYLVVIVPLLSVGIMGYTLWRAWSATDDLPFLRCHWRWAAKRTFVFGSMWILVALVFAGIYGLAGGDLKPQHYAAAGLVFLPTMVVTLVLVIMESEALQHARQRTLPSRAAMGCRLLAPQGASG